MFDRASRFSAVSAIRPRLRVPGNVLSFLMFAVIFLGLASAGEVQAYNVSGTITNTTNQTGRVFLTVSNGVSGVSVWVPANSNNTSYTIHGVSNGNWQINAFLNSQGNTTHYANNPTGQASFSINNGDSNNVNFSINAVAPVSPSALSTPNIVTCAPGGLINWSTDQMKSNGLYVPESIHIYWSTTSIPQTMVTAPITGNGDVLFLSGLTAGETINVTIVPVVGGVERSGGASNSALIGSPSGNSTVSGTVHSTGITKSSTTPLYIGMPKTDNSAFYCARVDPVGGPANDQQYSVSGLSAGTYQIYAILDMNNDGLIDLGDIQNDQNGFSNSNATLVTVNGTSPATAPDIYLSPLQDAAVMLGTNHIKSNVSSTFDSYTVQLLVSNGNKMPVNVQVTGCTGVSGNNFPIDFGLSDWGAFFNWVILPARPNIGDSCNLTVGYEDNSAPGSYGPQVATVLDDFPSPIYPQGNVGPISTNSSLFAWTTPNPLPAGYYDYMIQLNDGTTYNPVWHPQDNSNSNLPANQLNALYNYDNSGQSPLNIGQLYQLGIVVSDTFGNQAIYQQNFTPQGSGPTISGFNPTTGPAGTLVTINGNTFGSNPSVYFAGVPVSSYSSRTNSQIVANVPSGAPVGPIIVVNNNSGTSIGSSTQFIPTVTLQGTASTSGSSPTYLSGNVTTIGLSPFYPEVSQTNFPTSGYNLNGVPSGVPFSLHITSTGYLDTYSSVMSQTYNQASPSGYTMWTTSALAGKGVTLAAGKGLIHARVVYQDNPSGCGQGASGACVQGAVVTATSRIHPNISYTIEYSDPSTGNASSSATSTYTDGKFYVMNVDEGDYVAVTASKSGWSFDTQTFITHGGAVSATKVKGMTSLTINATGNGSGSVSSGMINFSYPASSSASVATGPSLTNVTLTANAGSGSTASWSGCDSGNGTATCTINNMNNPRAVTATFTLTQYQLTANAGGNGAGSVTLNPPGASYNYPAVNSLNISLGAGTSVTLTANASAGSTVAWTGNCDSTGGTSTAATCTINMNAAKTALATFTAATQNQLTVYAQGAGSGSISGGVSFSYPAVNNGSATLSSATLTASANSGSTATWVGNCDSVSGNGTGTATCSINSMNMPKSATATFSPVSCSNWLVFIAGTANYYETVHDAYFGVNASGQTIQMQGLDITDSPAYTGSNAINLQGGYDCAYSSISGFTTVHGTMTFSGGAVNIANVIIQ